MNGVAVAPWPEAFRQRPHDRRHAHAVPLRDGPRERAVLVNACRWRAGNEVDVEGIEPMTSVTPMRLKRREDVVSDGDQQAKVLANAPDAREGFFAVPKVVE